MSTIPKQNETALVNACLKYLPLEGVLAWRNNTGRLKDATGRSVPFGLCKGSSDIIGIMPKSGRFIAVECKIGNARPTALQEAFLESVRQQGGVAVCVWTLSELARAIRDERKR